MKKKVLIAAAAVALGALVTVGASLAFFTDTETAANVITTGNVNIVWHEVNQSMGFDKDIKDDVEGINFEGNLTPGAVLEKTAFVRNIGKNDAYIRVKIQFEDMPEGVTPNIFYGYVDDPGKKSFGQDIQEHISSSAGGQWSNGDDGYWYFKNIVKPGGKTDTFINQIEIPKTWNNNAADAAPKIKLIAEAIQSDNNLAAGYGLEELKAVFNNGAAGIEKYKEPAAVESSPEAEQ